MALLHLFSPSLFSLSSNFSSPSMVITTATSMSRLRRKCLHDLHPKSVIAIQFCTPFGAKEQREVIVRASSDTDGIDSGSAAQAGEAKEEDVPVENLPLESKLQEKLAQKLKMKLAKKIRLRRKRLVRKRRMRKKGRWPPSKMKKNKNV